jgi:hypothetical protein
VAMRKVAMPMTRDTLESLLSRRTDSSPAMRFQCRDVDATDRQKIRADAGGRSGEDGKGTWKHKNRGQGDLGEAREFTRAVGAPLKLKVGLMSS